jgi:hypothetical protein
VIGVIVNDSERDAVEEFFQLFKTPWKFWCPGERFDAVIATRYEPDLDSHSALPILILCCQYGHPVDDQLGLSVKDRIQSCTIRLGEDFLPIYSGLTVFYAEQNVYPFLECDCGVIGLMAVQGDTRVLRLGFNPFQELQFLLTLGQPAGSALWPALDLHINLLRTLLLNSGIDLVEVPPIPFGYRLTCCLTHDIDFWGIRRQGLDRTVAGFLYRATLGSYLDYSKGRRNRSQLLRNWKAALSWPFIYSGILPDFWNPVEEYRSVESNIPSSFYIVPFANQGGVSPTGAESPQRAVAYKLDEVAAEVRQCAEQGVEIGVHGLDAWRESGAGLREKQRIADLIQQEKIGVRMHWLYFDQTSPQKLEGAGFDYDSTIGYNDAVGFRAGTAQAFKFLDTSNLLELPLVIQDTALFYAGRMNLEEDKALELCGSLLNAVSRHGGVLTINWHCRSLAPERLWIEPYLRLLKMLQESQAWFATASQAVEWYRQRRRCQFLDGEICAPSTRRTGSYIIPRVRVRHWRARHYLPNYGFQGREVKFDFTDSAISEEFPENTKAYAQEM